MNTTGFLASGNSKSCKAMMDQLEYHVTCFTYTHSLTHMHTQCQLCLTALGRASWLGRHINWTIRTRRSDKNIPGTIHVNVQLSEKHFLSLILKTKKKEKKYLRKKEWQVQAETWKHHVSVASRDKSQPASLIGPR